jgi:hypothetical protein
VRVLHSFQGGPNDGAKPDAAILIDARGSICGTTVGGGSLGLGSVFEIVHTRSAYHEKVIHFFSGPDGGWPEASLISDSSGSLYGTTTTGGASKCRRAVFCGVVFKLTPSRAGYAITVLHSFDARHNGVNPKAAVIADARGNLYGTTSGSGGPPGGGVFSLTPSGSSYRERFFYNGDGPMAPLLLGRNGVMYGTTVMGGNCPITGGCGTVFEQVP